MIQPFFFQLNCVRRQIILKLTIVNFDILSYFFSTTTFFLSSTFHKTKKCAFPKKMSKIRYDKNKIVYFEKQTHDRLQFNTETSFTLAICLYSSERCVKITNGSLYRHFKLNIHVLYKHSIIIIGEADEILPSPFDSALFLSLRFFVGIVDDRFDFISGFV